MAMFTISLWGCVTDRKCSIPKGFECFNSKRVFIQYKQPVNGYTVKVMWLPYLNSKDNTTAETGVTTSLFFDSADNQFYINLEAKHIIDTLCYHLENPV